MPLLLRRAWYGLNQAFRRQISHAGATPDQFTALRTLCEGDPAGLTQSELTRAMSSDPNTVASLLERMENNGWLERKPHETDRRAQRTGAPSSIEQLAVLDRNLSDVHVLSEEGLAQIEANRPSRGVVARKPWQELVHYIEEVVGRAREEDEDGSSPSTSRSRSRQLRQSAPRRAASAPKPSCSTRR